MKNLVLIALMMTIAACAMPQPGMRKSPGSLLSGIAPKNPPAASAQYVDEVVEVLTEPAGARVQVNDAFVGYSPVKYSVRRFWRGAPGNMVLDPVKIDALPTAGGQCVQTGYFGEASRKVPSPVSFSMAACASAQPAYAPAVRKK